MLGSLVVGMVVIVTEHMPCISAYAHVYLVFLPVRTPIPYSTHPHPFTRICTGSYPQLQCIYVLFMLI